MRDDRTVVVQLLEQAEAPPTDVDLLALSNCEVTLFIFSSSSVVRVRKAMATTKEALLPRECLRIETSSDSDRQYEEVKSCQEHVQVKPIVAKRTFRSFRPPAIDTSFTQIDEGSIDGVKRPHVQRNATLYAPEAFFPSPRSVLDRETSGGSL
jgi:hypothetical protein